jgi:hypothetical protein
MHIRSTDIRCVGAVIVLACVTTALAIPAAGDESSATMCYSRTDVACVTTAIAIPPGGDESSATMYYSRTDGAVGAVDIDTETEAVAVPSNAFAGAIVGAAREIAFDPETRLLWYSATDNIIHSVNVDTLVAGGTISGVPGAAIGAERHLFIDYARRALLVPITDGSVEIYSLSTRQSVGSIPAALFLDGNVGAFRHFASDPTTGNLWYAATDGSFREIDPDTSSLTGRQVPFSEQTGGNPGAFRHFVVDTGRNLLLYMVTDDSVASVDLGTLDAAAFTLSSDVFVGASVGAGRIITYDSPQRCGQPVSDRSNPIVTDCLAILRTSVGLRTCSLCVCDTDGSGMTVVTDALRCLARAVGQSVTFSCTSCS